MKRSWKVLKITMPSEYQSMATPLPSPNNPWNKLTPNLGRKSQKKSLNIHLFLNRSLNQGVKISFRHEKKELLVNAPTMSVDSTGEKTDVRRDIATKIVQL